MELRPINPRSKLELSPDEAAPPLGVETGRALKKATEKEEKRISALQRVFYADARHALLIVLQGRDASGKDGTICKVFGAVNPLSFLALLPNSRIRDSRAAGHEARPGNFLRMHPLAR